MSEDCTKGSLERLAEHFSQKISELRLCLDLSGSTNHESISATVGALHCEVKEMEVLIANLKSQVDNRRKNLQCIKMMKERMTEFNVQVQRNLEKASRLAELRASAETNAAAETFTIAETSAAEESTDATPASLNDSSNQLSDGTEARDFTPMYSNRNGIVADSPGSGNTSHDVSSMMASLEHLRKMGNVMFVPCIAPLSAEEFESVPTVARREITLEMVNHLIGEITRVVQEKYRLLANSNKSTLSIKDRSLLKKYCEQEYRDTKGSYFFVDRDLLRGSSVGRLDATTRNMLAMLRQCSRLREFSGGGFNRYAIVQQQP